MASKKKGTMLAIALALLAFAGTALATTYYIVDDGTSGEQQPQPTLQPPTGQPGYGTGGSSAAGGSSETPHDTNRTNQSKPKATAPKGIINGVSAEPLEVGAKATITLTLTNVSFTTQSYRATANIYKSGKNVYADETRINNLLAGKTAEIGFAKKWKPTQEGNYEIGVELYSTDKKNLYDAKTETVTIQDPKRAKASVAQKQAAYEAAKQELWDKAPLPPDKTPIAVIALAVPALIIIIGGLKLMKRI